MCGLSRVQCVGRYLCLSEIFKKAKQVKNKKKVEVCELLDSKHEGHKKSQALGKFVCTFCLSFFKMFYL